MASMSSIVRIASAAVVGNEAPSSAAAANASSWKSYDAFRLKRSLRVPSDVVTFIRCPCWGLNGLKTEILPLSPVISACSRSTEEENMEQPTWALPPSGSEKWASMARSTPGEESFASALITLGPRDEEAQEADRVAAHVHGGASGQCQLVADVALFPERGGERHVDPADVAQLARPHDLHQAPAQRVVLVVEGLHHHPTGGAVVRLGHSPGLVGVGGERLLAQDVFAGLEGGDGPVPVEAVGEGVVDGVDLGVLDQFRVTAQDAGNALFTGKLRGSAVVACRHRGHEDAPGPAGRLDHGGGGDAGRPEDPDPQHVAVTGSWGPGPPGGSEKRPRRAFRGYGTEW